MGRSPRSARVVGRIGRGLEGGEVVPERRCRPSEPTLETANLNHALLDSLAHLTYLTVEQAWLYTQFPTIGAFRKWVERKRVRKGHAGWRLRFRRVDLDRALAAAYEREPKATGT